MPPKNRRRWYQFGVRSLLILTLLCAIGLVAWLRYVEPFRHEQRVAAMVEKVGGSTETEAENMGWVANLFQGGFFSHITSIDLTRTRVDDTDLRLLRDLPGLRTLHLGQTTIGDTGIGQLSNLPELQVLVLADTKITDAGVHSLPQSWKLNRLSLHGTDITDEALPAIAKFGELRFLSLSKTNITDAGLVHLKTLTRLEELLLFGTEIGDAGLSHVRGMTGLTRLHLMDTNVSEASLPLLANLPALKALPLHGSQIIPSAFRRTLPQLANQRILRELGRPTVAEFIDTPIWDVAGYLTDYHKITIVASRQGADVMLSDESDGITLNVQDQQLGEVLSKLLGKYGLRAMIRYGCLQLLASEDAEQEEVRMVIGDGEQVSRALSHSLYANCEVLEGRSIFSPANQRYPLRCRLNDLILASNTQLGLKIEVDESDFSDRPELLSRQIAVPEEWTCSLSSALECMFDLFDVHGVIKNDTIWIRPGAAPVAEIER